MSDRRTALATAAAAFSLTAPIAYVTQRLYEVARSGPIDPLSVLRDAHTAFYWRALTATWWAGLIAILVYATVIRRGASERSLRALAWVSLPLAVLVTLVAYGWP
ncbi:MAG: hypothetical protein AB7S26_00925 [Sandaracinaceae bacterium]